MNSKYLHNFVDSFRNFFEYELFTEGQAYRNVTSGSLYQTSCEHSGKVAYSSPYGQFIYDSSISGANIVSGVYSGASNTFIPRGTGGLIIDHERGRILFNSGVIGNFKANYAVKDLNIYTTNASDTQLLLTTRQSFRPKFIMPTTGIDPKRTYGPMIFIKKDSSYNDGFALGGEDNTCVHFRAIVVAEADNEYLVDGVGSIFQDAARKSFLILNNPPLNRYGDIRTGSYYNYLEDISGNYDQSKLACITMSEYYRFDSTTETSLDPDYACGFIEFRCEIPRFPRI